MALELLPSSEKPLGGDTLQGTAGHPGGSTQTVTVLFGIGLTGQGPDDGA